MWRFNYHIVTLWFLNICSVFDNNIHSDLWNIMFTYLKYLRVILSIYMFIVKWPHHCELQKFWDRSDYNDKISLRKQTWPCVCVACVCVACVHVSMPVACFAYFSVQTWGKEKDIGVLHHSLTYPLDIRSLTDPGAGLAANKPKW